MKKVATLILLAGLLAACGKQETPPPAAAAPAPAPAPVVAGNPEGEAAYKSVCVMCHGAGVGGAPKTGDKAAWAPRIAQGKETLYKHALEGYTGQLGMMPPKGGSTTLSDEQMKHAVDYLVSKAE